MATRITIYADAITAQLLGGENASKRVRDALRWAAALDLTEERACSLDKLLRSLAGLGVDDPLGYAEAVAERAYRDALDGMLSLTSGGWTGGEILAVMDATMGSIYGGGMSIGSMIAADMHDGAELGTVDLAGWGVSPERWADRAQAVHDGAEAARMLMDIGRVVWSAQGSALERALRRDLRRDHDHDHDLDTPANID